LLGIELHLVVCLARTPQRKRNVIISQFNVFLSKYIVEFRQQTRMWKKTRSVQTGWGHVVLLWSFVENSSFHGRKKLKKKKTNTETTWGWVADIIFIAGSMFFWGLLEW